jgi:hypothetical protein
MRRRFCAGPIFFASGRILLIDLSEKFGQSWHYCLKEVFESSISINLYYRWLWTSERAAPSTASSPWNRRQSLISEKAQHKHALQSSIPACDLTILADCAHSCKSRMFRPGIRRVLSRIQLFNKRHISFMFSTGNQCCGSGSGRIRTFLVGSGSGRLGPDPVPDPGLNKWLYINLFCVYKSHKYLRNLCCNFLVHEDTFYSIFS